MMTVVFGWLPMIDLPLPLVMVGGLLLAIASNRMESSQSADSQHSSLVSKADATSPPINRVEQSRPPMSTVQSPSLPNWGVKRDRPISPPISPKQAPTVASISASDNHSTATQLPSALPEPQLPSFTRPKQKKKRRVSFTIEK